MQVNYPDRYPYISDQDLVMLAFPSSAVQNRRVLLQRTKAVVAQLQEAGELRVVKGRDHSARATLAITPAPAQNPPSVVRRVGPDASTIANCYARVHHDHLSPRSSLNIKLIVSAVFAVLLPPRRHTRPPPPPSRAQGDDHRPLPDPRLKQTPSRRRMPTNHPPAPRSTVTLTPVNCYVLAQFPTQNRVYLPLPLPLQRRGGADRGRYRVFTVGHGE